MKTKIIISSIVAMGVSACSSSKVASTSSYEDDIYYNPKKEKVTVASQYNAPSSGVSTTAAESYSTQTADNAGVSDYERYRQALDSGQTVEQATAAAQSAPVEYYDQPATSNGQDYAYVETTKKKDAQGNTYVTNNYYDDSYAARINRFDRPYYGYGYYDPWYYGPGTSLWYNSYFGWGMSFSFGWGYPYYSPYYSPYYYPYYGYYSSYRYPYWGGGCWDCYYPSYYGYDRYPSRTRVSGPIDRRSGSYAYGSGSSVRRTSTSAVSPSARRTSSASDAYRTSNTRSSYTRAASDSRRTTTATTSSATRSGVDNNAATRTSRTTTTSPTRSSSQDYTVPRTDNNSSTTRQRSSSSDSYSTPSSSSRRSSTNSYYEPSGSSRSSSSYSSPSRSSNTYSTPSRSSTPSYSSPSRSSSSGSYSAPSRSSSSSSGSSSSSSRSSGGGGGGRR